MSVFCFPYSMLFVVLYVQHKPLISAALHTVCAWSGRQVWCESEGSFFPIIHSVSCARPPVSPLLLIRLLCLHISLVCFLCFILSCFTFQPTWTFDEKIQITAANSCLILAAHFMWEPEERFPQLSFVAGCTRAWKRITTQIRTHAEKSGNAVVSARHFCMCVFLQHVRVTATFLLEDICFWACFTEPVSFKVTARSLNCGFMAHIKSLFSFVPPSSVSIHISCAFRPLLSVCVWHICEDHDGVFACGTMDLCLSASLQLSRADSACLAAVVIFIVSLKAKTNRRKIDCYKKKTFSSAVWFFPFFFTWHENRIWKENKSASRVLAHLLR